MAGRRPFRASDAEGPAALLPLVFSRPKEAAAAARALLATDPSPYDASLAYQAIGLVERDFGDLAAAIRHLRQAVSLGRRSGVADREADAMAALGVALINAGRTQSGLSALKAAVTRACGLTAARIQFRRAGALRLLGRHGEALAELRRALPVLRRARDTIWLARALTLRALMLLAIGQARRAERDLEVAAQMFATTGQEHDSVVALHNRGLVSFCMGDLPAALVHFDEAEQRYGELGTVMPELSVDRCALLLAAGLPREALTEADEAIGHLQRQRGRAIRRAELLLTAAHAALAAGDVEVAEARARAAARLFSAQRRDWWSAHCALLLLQIRFHHGTVTVGLMNEAARVAARLTELGAPQSAQAHLLAGRVAGVLHRRADTDRHLAAAAHLRHQGPALSRAGGWLAEALRAEAAGQPRRTLGACRRGLHYLDEHRETLGAPELRAFATAHGAELASIALRVSLASGRPRSLLAWAERWRATALAATPLRPPTDPAMQAGLTRLRELAGRLDSARSRGAPAADLLRDQRRIEREIRARARHLRGTGSSPERPLDVVLLQRELAGARLIEIVAVDGDLHVLLCRATGVHRFRAGSITEAAIEVEYARAALRRLAFPGAASTGAMSALLDCGSRLERLLLGPAADQLDDMPAVVVPPASLHGVPWPILPVLHDRVLNVAPSARAWLRARQASPSESDRVVLVRGPGLRTNGAEVTTLAAIHDRATVLDRGQATASRVLDALDGSRLAHLAAHGTFRADSPLFSSLRLADGPLTVHDFQRLRRAPYRLILPSCESGRLMPAGADELLGLATALLPLGTAGVVASVVAVNDEACVPLMIGLHSGLQLGMSLAEALRSARHHLPSDPLLQATGLSFVAVGAG
ncbi:MAG: CHAT domain-containing protein [Micromonosporaceae bacterium]